ELSPRQYVHTGRCGQCNPNPLNFHRDQPHTTHTELMIEKIRIAIAGYGNLGRGTEAAIAQNPDMELTGVYTRRDPASVQTLNGTVAVRHLDDIDQYKNEIDVLVLCGGSKNDLPEQGPALAARFNTVDSYDTHARIPQYFDAVDAAARSGGNVALISVGWDPGLFSLNRLFGETVLPQGDTYTFWGTGLSQGHSAAVRRVPGVKAAVQYSVPSIDAIEQVRSGLRPTLTTRQKHTRECFVVLAEGADAEQVREAIVTMPDYFADYDTTVNFISEETLRREHSAMPHGGFVIRSGESGDGDKQVIEYS